MSCDDGLVMQLHPGVLRNHHPPTLRDFGTDRGADIPVAIEFTRALRPLLERYGDHPNFRIVLFTLDETTWSRELAPLAGFYPSVYLGAPWWFLDTPDAMLRFRAAVTDTAGFAKTSGFVDDTRAFCSIPVRHDTARRVDCAFLSRLVVEHRLDEDGGGRDRPGPRLPAAPRGSSAFDPAEPPRAGRRPVRPGRSAPSTSGWAPSTARTRPGTRSTPPTATTWGIAGVHRPQPRGRVAAPGAGRPLHPGRARPRRATGARWSASISAAHDGDDAGAWARLARVTQRRPGDPDGHRGRIPPGRRGAPGPRPPRGRRRHRASAAGLGARGVPGAAPCRGGSRPASPLVGSGGGPITVVPCDNLMGNGAAPGTSVLEMCEAVDPASTTGWRPTSRSSPPSSTGSPRHHAAGPGPGGARHRPRGSGGGGDRALQRVGALRRVPGRSAYLGERRRPPRERRQARSRSGSCSSSTAVTPCSRTPGRRSATPPSPGRSPTPAAGRGWTSGGTGSPPSCRSPTTRSPATGWR